MLDLDGVESESSIGQIVNALRSTPAGLRMYVKVCERQMKLRELQKKGGPRKLTMPSRSTDEDLGAGKTVASKAWTRASSSSANTSATCKCSICARRPSPTKASLTSRVRD